MASKLQNGHKSVWLVLGKHMQCFYAIKVVSVRGLTYRDVADSSHHDQTNTSPTVSYTHLHTYLTLKSINKT